MICSDFIFCLKTGSSKFGRKCCVCRRESNEPKITCQENKRTYSLINDQNNVVINFLIDGGVISDEDEIRKCDRLYYVHDENGNSVIFIELKGKKIVHALDQLYATANLFRDCFKDCRKHFRVVCSGAPKIANDSKSIALKRKIFKEFNSQPIIKLNKLEEKYSHLNSEVE